MNETEKILLQLLKISLTGKSNVNEINFDNWSELAELSVMHGVGNCVYYALNSVKSNIDADSLKLLKDVCFKAISKDETQRQELDKIFKMFDENDIDYIPVKGVIIKNFYPSSDMRVMSDADILTKEKNAEKIDGIMKKLGYSVDGKTVPVTTYFKAPFVSVEIHRQLFEDSFIGSDYFSYENIWKKATKESETSSRFQMNINDFYCYLLYHAAKHFLGCGTGIRTVCDEWFILNNLKDKTDNKVTDKILNNLGIKEFSINLENTALKWFGSSDNMQDNTTDFENDILTSGGVFGVYQNSVNNKIKNQGFFKYVLSRIFPPYIIMINQFSFLKGRKYLIPFYWIFRFIRLPFKKKNSVKKEINALKNKE